MLRPWRAPFGLAHFGLSYAGLAQWIHDDVIHTILCMATRLREQATRARPAMSVDTEAQYARLVLPQMDAAYNLARYLSRDADAAQDIVQNAFLKAHRNFDQFRGGDAKAWLLVIVRNCFHDWLRDQRRKQRIEADAGEGVENTDLADISACDCASSEDTPEAALIRKTEAEQVRAVLNRLPRLSREVLVLRELEELSYKEISEVLAVPIGTVMSRLARARREFGIAWSTASKVRQEQCS
jgi:RNA polymerase sigma-70 factor (ECF subfamily)